MASQAELKEAPLVEERLDHTIKPKYVKKPPKSSKKLTRKVSRVDQENIIRNRDVAELKGVKRKKRVLTEEHKQKMREGKLRKKKAKLTSKSILGEATQKKMGDNVIATNVEQPKKHIVAAAPTEPDLHSFEVEDAIPHGSQILDQGKMPEHMLQSLQTDTFMILDQDYLNNIGRAVEVEDIEHSSAMKTTSIFKPARTIFNQNANFVERAMNELHSQPTLFNLEQRNTATELGKYDNMLEVADRMEYIRQDNMARRGDPQLPNEQIQSSTPATTQPSFMRDIKGKSIGFYGVGGDV